MRWLTGASLTLSIAAIGISGHLLSRARHEQPKSTSDSQDQGLKSYDFSSPRAALISEAQIRLKGDILTQLDYYRSILRLSSKEETHSIKFHEQFESGGQVILLYTVNKSGSKQYRSKRMEKDAKSGLWHPSDRTTNATFDDPVVRRIKEWTDSGNPKVEVIVAARDLPVGTQLNKEDLKTAIKRKTMSRDSVPPTIIESEEELLQKRLTRTVRAEEMINKGDVTKGGVVSIPPGMSMVTLPISLSSVVAGFVGPGSKVDVLASVRLENKLRVLPILVNMLVLAVDGNTGSTEKIASQTLCMLSFAVTREQALLIKLAQARNCDMSLLLRNPDEKENEYDKSFNIDDVTKLLQSSK